MNNVGTPDPPGQTVCLAYATLYVSSGFYLLNWRGHLCPVESLTPSHQPAVLTLRELPVGVTDVTITVTHPLEVVT